jgi:hypothetical protein
MHRSFGKTLFVMPFTVLSCDINLIHSGNYNTYFRKKVLAERSMFFTVLKTVKTPDFNFVYI